MKRTAVVLAALVAVAAACAQEPGTPAPVGNPPLSEPPRLVVVCAVDQLAKWVFAAAEPHLADDGGFRRLLREGARFSQCAYEHACTETGPGHATIGTGVPARVHGIVRNKWWVRDRRATTYCVDEVVAALPDAPEGANRGPGSMVAPTLAAAMKKGVPGSRVASVAWKDRSAILMAGPQADLVIWCESSTGRFVTNSTWVDAMPAWLTEWNAGKPIDRFHGTVWERTGPDAAYAGLVDERPYETPHANGGGGRTLPQPMTGGIAAPGSAFYAQVYASPFGNTAVRLAAEATVRGMELGADAIPDLLCVGFSSTDVMGHVFGPESVEARDGLLRLDRDLAMFLQFLDAQVGAGKWAIWLTADHGVGPTPEWEIEQGREGGRGLLQTMVGAVAEQAVGKRLGPPPSGRRFVSHVGEFSVYLDDDVLQAVRGDRELAEVRRDAARAVAAAAVTRPGIAAAFATEDLLAPDGAPDALRRSLVDGLFPGRAGEVQFVVKPHWLDGATPASHGTPHLYDREVVGIARGGGAPPGATIDEPCTPGFGVVWFSRLLGLPPPAHASDRVPPAFVGAR